MTSSTGIANWVEATQSPPKPLRVRRENEGLRRFFWLYFWLLLGEGVLRKWVAPSLATPLLLIRDPIPFAVLWIGIRTRVFPRTFVVYVWASLALACLIAGLFVLPDHPLIALYGFRSDFLHFTMLALAPIVLDSGDIDRVIRAVIYASVPIALLMAWQFHAPSDSWINSGVDNTFRQIESAQGHIRPPGPFSFISGPTCFCALLAAVLTGAAVDRRQIARPLLFVGSAALIVAALYSASRGLVGNIVVVVAAGMLGAMACNPRVFGRYLIIVLALGFIGLFIGSSSLMEDSVDTFSERVSTASAGEQMGGASSLVGRYVGEFVAVVPALAVAPFAGEGLGVGTNGGASLLTGKTSFLLAESEWPRIVLESGPVLGLLYIGFRLGLAVFLGWRSLQSVRRGSVLPACLFGACAGDLAVGQFGQTTILGFTMLTAGLCLAAAERRDESPAESDIGSAALPGLTDDQAVPA